MTESENINELKLIVDRQDSEAKLHWSRNSYFLVVMSILILAFGQKPVENLFQLKIFRGLTSFLGIVLNLVWCLIQYRSSQYVLYYKTAAQELSKKSKTTDIYPKKLGGIEMRRLAYALPLAFLFIWVAFFLLNLMNSGTPVTDVPTNPSPT